MSFARSFDCPVVINQVGRIAPAEDDPTTWNRLVQALSDLGRYGQHLAPGSRWKPVRKVAQRWPS